jgi:two-component system chemotaxis sensor kinase CheA
MDKKKQEFLERLLATFRVEADEHIKTISSGLIQLEKSGDEKEQTAIIESIYREAHSLKGAARSVDHTAIESICQHLENILQRFKHGGFTCDAAIFDVLHQAVDIIEKLNKSERQDPPGTPDIPGITRKLAGIEKGGPVPGTTPKTKQPPTPSMGKKSKEGRREILKAVEARRLKKQQAAPADAAAPTIRLSAEKLENALLQSEEIIYGKLSCNRLASELKSIRQELDTRQKKLHALTPSDIKILQKKMREVSKTLETDRRIIGSLIDAHLEDMKALLMMPFSSLTEGFPKTVRDLARDKGKEIDIIIEGAENKIDKRVLEGIKDPLLHLIRNAIDHGIESPPERKRRKKPPNGTILMTISRFETRKVEIRFADDGAGIDLEKLKGQIIRSGITTEEKLQKLTDTEILDMLYRSEFSTSPLVTDISGRGLGLAIAREKVEKLGGSISLETQVHKGTTFRILLPLTLATFRGVLVKAGDAKFIVPTLNVERVLRVRTGEIKTVENRETIAFDRRAVSHVPLAHVLELQRKTGINKTRDLIQVLVLNARGTRIAFSVDEVLDEEEVMVKGLGVQLKRVINIAGAAILSSTEMVPILNVPDLIKSAVKTAVGQPMKSAGAEKAKPKSVLLVEDSITSRILLKNILESAGYQVKVAVDGAAGWTSLQEEPCDAVISDIDMPRMDGFELTAKIRTDKRLAETPVVLMTGMETGEDREKSIEVGADACIVKSSFDQSNLLTVLKGIL